MQPMPLAVWVEDVPTDLTGLDRTLASLARGTVGPTQILQGDLGDALADSRAPYVVLSRTGDQLSLLALERLGQALTLAPGAQLVTCDEDQLTTDERRVNPRVRPGPSPDRWLACDDSGTALVVRREAALVEVRRLSHGPAWRHELALRLAGADGAGHAHVPMFLSHGTSAQPAQLAPSVLTQVLHDQGQMRVVESTSGSHRSIRRPLSFEPLVEVVICFKDKPDLLRRCLRSLFALTRYDRLSVALVDNGSAEAATADLLLELRDDPRVRVLRDERPFNFAALNNAAARSSGADFLVFLNNDTEVINADWLERLLEEAARPEVGAVAPLLLYPGGEVQHAGAALAMHGYAGHPFAGLAPDRETPFGRAGSGTRNWLAVTAACLMVQRDKFEAVAGFDETFVVAGNDVDLCLRLTSAGYRTLCVTDAVLIHDESRSRGSYIDPGDFAASERSYGQFRILGDPFYSPNLTLSRTDCAIRGPEELSA